jgi:hypothetical protein
MSKRGAKVIVNWAALLVQSGAPVVQMCNLGVSRDNLQNVNRKSVLQEHAGGKPGPDGLWLILRMNAASLAQTIHYE